MIWSKCKIVSTDAARATDGILKGIVDLIKKVASEVVSSDGLTKNEARYKKSKGGLYLVFQGKAIFKKTLLLLGQSFFSA